jgi:hypothetical protein
MCARDVLVLGQGNPRSNATHLQLRVAAPAPFSFVSTLLDQAGGYSLASALIGKSCIGQNHN